MSNENEKLNQETPDQTNANEVQANLEKSQPESSEKTEATKQETPETVEEEKEVSASPEESKEFSDTVQEAKGVSEPEEKPKESTEAVEEQPLEVPIAQEAEVVADTEPVAESAPVDEKEAVQAEIPQAPQPAVPGDFDWDAIGKKDQAYTTSEREKLEELYNKTFSSVVEHEVVEGTISALNDREAVVNINFKSDGVIPRGELRYNPELKVGDAIEVYVESQEDQTGQLILSHKKARILKSWERVNTAFENDEIIKGYVKSRTKGGLIVDVFGIEAFLPGSQIDVKPIRDYDIYVDKVMEFKVVKINHEYKNVVVSHKALIERELEQQKAEIISKLEKGQVLEGTVKNITSYGVFVDLGGVDGLVHITDLSWGRINHPEEIVELDQKIKVVILDFDDNKKRIALGLKQLTPHPWDALDQNLKVGDKVKGKVVVIADYGAFIEIAPGVEGLIHVSEMSWSQHLRTAQDFLKVADEVDAVILTLDREERKMSLGMKQLIPDPWENIKSRYPVGSKHSATVRNFTNFGIFVELEEGVDGLIHISDLSWSKKIKHPAEFTKINDPIEVIVLDVDEENRRLSLGHKQLEENPWDVFESVFTIDSVHQGTIVGTSDKGVIVALPYGVEGFAPTRHIVKEDGSAAKIDETLDFKVIEFNKESKKIVVSHTKVYQDIKYAERATEVSEIKARESATKKAVKKMKDGLEKTTLGDLDVLANLKSEIEKTEQTVQSAKKEEAIKKLEAMAAVKAKDTEVKNEDTPKDEAADDTSAKEETTAEKNVDVEPVKKTRAKAAKKDKPADDEAAEKKTTKKSAQKDEEKPEVKAEEKPEAKSDEKQVAKIEETPEVKVEEKPEVKVEEKPEVKAEEKPEVKVEEKPEVKAEVKPEVKAEEKPEVKAEEGAEKAQTKKLSEKEDEDQKAEDAASEK